ncbi:MAG: glycosyltransferase family 39 protein [Lachnospiraceae bacterium]|nr:glycosyltransferase family 39 protein [Lachnospiraceae bacterium]
MQKTSRFRAGNFFHNLPYFISGCAVIALNTCSLPSALIGAALGAVLFLSALYFENIHAFWKRCVTRGILLFSAAAAFISAAVFYELFSMTSKTRFISDLFGMSQRAFFLIPAILGGAAAVYFLSVVLCAVKTAVGPDEKSVPPSCTLHKTDLLILGVILTAGLLAGVCLTSQKVSFHVDEMLTFGLSNSYYQPFFEEPSVNGGVVITGAEFTDYLTVSDHPFSYGSVIYNQIQDVHPPLYYFLIHTICSAAPGLSFAAVGYIVNALFAALTMAGLFVWAYRRFDRLTACLAVISFAFGAGILSMFVFFRMYMMLVYFTVLLAVSLYDIYAGGGEGRARMWLGIALCLGALTQYYFLVYAFFACLVLAVLLCVEKRWKELRDTAAVVGASACIYYSIWGNIAIRHIFSGYKGKQALQSAATLEGTFDEIRAYGDMLFKQIFSHTLLSAGFFILLAVFLSVLAVRAVRGGRENITHFRGLLLLLLPCLLYVCMIAKVSSDEAERYIVNVVPLFWVSLLAVIFYICRNVKGRAVWSAALAALIVADLLTACEPEYLYLSDESMVEYMESLDQDTVCVYYKSTDWNSQTQYACFLMNYQTTYVVNGACLDWLEEQDLWKNETVLLLAEDSAGYEALFQSIGCTSVEWIGTYERVQVFSLSR